MRVTKSAPRPLKTLLSYERSTRTPAETSTRASPRAARATAMRPNASAMPAEGASRRVGARTRPLSREQVIARSPSPAAPAIRARPPPSRHVDGIARPQRRRRGASTDDVVEAHEEALAAIAARRAPQDDHVALARELRC